jgi:uncharacterized membrane protein
MNLKQFFKPDGRKIVIFVVLILVTSFPRYKLHFELGITQFGLPFPFSQKVVNPMSKTTYIRWEFKNLIVDIIIWYLLSCLIIWILDKLKRKS